MLSIFISQSKTVFQFELQATVRHLWGCYQARRFRSQPHLQLNLACGPNYKQGWVNIDLLHKVADLTLDLRKPLPFFDNSCEAVYCEHFLEHLPYPQGAERFLAEVKRVLKPHGTATMVVPDTVWPLQAYFKGKQDPYFRIVKKKGWHPPECQTAMEHLNFHFRQDDEHQFAYDTETLQKVFRRAGFRDIKARPFDPRIDNPVRHPGSLYMVGKKEM